MHEWEWLLSDFHSILAGLRDIYEHWTSHENFSKLLSADLLEVYTVLSKSYEGPMCMYCLSATRVTWRCSTT